MKFYFYIHLSDFDHVIKAIKENKDFTGYSNLYSFKKDVRASYIQMSLNANDYTFTYNCCPPEKRLSYTLYGQIQISANEHKKSINYF